MIEPALFDLIFITFANPMSLQQNLHIPFDNIIWCISPDNSSNYVLIESRDEQRKKVRFFGIDIADGQVHSQFTTENDDWWVGIESVQDKKVLLHGYESDESPIHNDLMCFDLTNGSELWRFENFQVQDISSETIRIKSNDDIEKTINWHGEECKQHVDQVNNDSKFQNPNPYFQDSDYFKTVSEFIHQNFDHNPIELIEYLEWKNYVVISYYIAQNSKLANILKVLDEDGNLLFEDILGKELKGIGINTFFLSENQLIFTKNKTELFGFLID